MEQPPPNSFIIGRDIYYPGILKDVRKSPEPFRPVFEVFINALEAIRDRPSKDNKGRIEVRIITTPNLIGHSFHSIEVIDNGVGFDTTNFERFLTFKDNRKGPGNKGSGRMQLAHFFDRVDYVSTFQDENGKLTRSFSVSKDNILAKNALVFFKELAHSATNDVSTRVALIGIVAAHRNDYASLSAEELKEKLLTHFWLYFALNKDDFPDIKIERYESGKVVETQVIAETDIPPIDKDVSVDVHYSGRSDDRLAIVRRPKTETFSVKCFRMPKDKLTRNAIKLTSKNEIVESVKIQLESLSFDDDIDGNRYLFLVSGDYIDNKESETRGELTIPTRSNFLDKDGLFETDEILLDDIQAGVNRKVLEAYAEIRKRLQEKESNLEELRETYILDDAAIIRARIGINDSDEKILAKVYSAESESTARKDAYIKEKIDAVKALNTADDDYVENLARLVGDLVNTIPEANRLSLTHYVARRRIVLELFDTILGRELDVQKTSPRSIDEKLLHNLIFQQTSTSAESSDLWLINEDFIYFSGNSENSLSQIKVDGELLFKSDLSAEEERFVKSLGEDRLKKRPDILLFPQESKCIIIEFKDPDVNLSDHLAQINKYAGYIRNLTNDKFQFDTFYGYLIGEAFDRDEIRLADADFKDAYHFNYMFRPAKTVAGLFGREDGALYTEIISYRSILERAAKRNEMFLEKLGRPLPDGKTVDIDTEMTKIALAE